MADTQISNPIAKGVAAVGVATGAQVAEIGNTATSTINALFTLSPANIASWLAALFVFCQLCDWWWKKVWRPMFERNGWIKAKPRKVYTAREWADRIAAQDSDQAPLG